MDTQSTGEDLEKDLTKLLHECEAKVSRLDICARLIQNNIIFFFHGFLFKWSLMRIKLTGIIQLCGIADARMRGTPLRNLKMFEELCGSDVLANIILTTTFWNQVIPMSVPNARSN
ncbi:uncharacterized protein LACBIDRAFT_329295 [Laccaria bicolor S238N-H82]|uniref:Predicted protein n=1 Tax=Laccaria bicolor (strain S238N-H82 / ATCC MYA-4686) TaxID=486041 RepID=B0DHK8_LACBS|nr:uncharacterized protein LACBIDRAFT_329295 [Laccaria bicolor S238N-H82]EDR05744.1 predicted protein [Laccaria bicolor S238N-H82]|eukprot:XP_001883420.1 predicted protein [Laccaria bicolor S238N-H82]